MKVHNPATGALIAEVPQASPEIIAERAAAARAAQPAWAARPLRERMEILQRFRVGIAAEVESLAATLTAEVGKPIRQSRNEVNRLLPRIDFFIAQAEAAIGTRQLHDEGGTREVLGFDALGVIVNISAWNYPYFVGGNVFVPALLAGNAVLYKPSEFATLTGLHIARLLHEAGVPPDVFASLVGGWCGRRADARATDRRRVLHRLACHRPAHRRSGRPALHQAATRARREGCDLRGRRRRCQRRCTSARRRRDVQRRPELLGRAHPRA